jgi:hypothetical protein
MNLNDNMRITRHILVATINAGLTRKCIRQGTENDRQIDFYLEEATDPSSNPSRSFTFTHIETEIAASVSHDEMGGVLIVAILLGNAKTDSSCLGVVIGRLYPARPNSAPAVLVLEQAGLCGGELVPERIFSMNHEYPNGYSLIMQ